MSPALQALPSGAVAVDYVDIGDIPTEVGHNLAGWGPVEPATTGGAWGGEDQCRVIWEAGSPNVYALVGRTATIDMDFGSTMGTKFLALRWLDGIGHDDDFDFTVSGVAGTFSVTDGTDSSSETWRDLGVWDVGPITGWHTITLSATGTAWGSFGTYGQCAFSEMATFVANCWPEPPDDVVAEPPLVAEPTGAVQVDFVDIGKLSSEAGHTMSSWGPIVPPPGAYGGEDDCRVIWDVLTGSTTATIDMDFGEAPGHKYVALRWLDGMSYADSFDMTIAGAAGTFSLTDLTSGHPENWYFLCVWDVGPVVGVRTITFTATDLAWSMWGTYGQVAFSQIATLADVCDGPCGPDLVPDELGVTPPLQCVPDYANQVDHADIGNEGVGRTMSSWGPVEPATHGGSWGGVDDCRVIWDVASDTQAATIDMDFGSGTGTKYVGLRWLDGMANTGGDANDSFTMTVGANTYTVTNGTPNHAETWYELYVWDVGVMTGFQTITLTATGAKWSGWSTYGQVAFSDVYVWATDLVIEPPMESLPDCAVPVDFVDIGNEGVGRTMSSWGPVEPATHGGSWGGEDDCRVIWDPLTSSRSATIDMDFGTGTGDKYLTLRWLDGMANMGGLADDSFTVTVAGNTYSMTNGTASHPEVWYDLCAWNVGTIIGVHTITLNATAVSQWSGWATYGQVAFSSIGTYEEFCEADAPAEIEFDPDTSPLVDLPTCTTTIDYVDIGALVSEAVHNLQGWGNVVGQSVPGSGAWGSEDDCRVIWEKASPDAVALVGKCATIDLDFGAAVGTKYLAMRWLDGIANDGVVQGAHDSFRFTVSGSDTVYTVHDLTVGMGENWYDLCVWDVGEIKGVHTITLCAEGSQWAGFNTYGQVGFSEMATKVGCAPAERKAGRTAAMVKVNATVRLVGVQGPVTRCINFTVGSDTACGTPNSVDVLFTGNPAIGTVTFEVEDDVWTRMNAKDEQHAVSATSTLSQLGSVYYADVALDLRGGDTDNNDVVEIDDVTWLIATFGEAADGGTHPWDTVRCADFSDNGFVGTEDFTFLAENWLAFEDFQCGGSRETGGGGSGAGESLLQGARASAPVADLPAWAANRADLNRDGVVNVEDVERFEQLHGLGNALSSKMELTASQQPAKEKIAR